MEVPMGETRHRSKPRRKLPSRSPVRAPPDVIEGGYPRWEAIAVSILDQRGERILDLRVRRSLVAPVVAIWAAAVAAVYGAWLRLH
jgi:hypothetical protein